MGTDGGTTRSQSTVRLDRPWDSHASAFSVYRSSSLFKGYTDDLLAEHSKEARSSGVHKNPQVVSNKRLLYLFYIPARSSPLVTAFSIALLAYRITCTSTPRRINHITKIKRSVSLLLNLPLFSLYSLLVARVHSGTYYGARGFITPRITATKVQTLLQYSSAPRTYSIICIGSESCVWSIVGLPGSCVCYLTFRYID